MTGFLGNAKAVSTHSRPKAAGYTLAQYAADERVSTHSRPKAAGRSLIAIFNYITSFNSQPPEGGWLIYLGCSLLLTVSTHSRPKAAGPAA